VYRYYTVPAAYANRAKGLDTVIEPDIRDFHEANTAMSIVIMRCVVIA